MGDERKPSSAQAWGLGLAAVAVAALGVGGAVVALNAPQATPPSALTPSAPEPHGPPEPEPAAVAQREAEDLRKLAKADCNAGQWGECTAKLDRASDLDPQGNLARSVQRMRKQANRASILQRAEVEPSLGARAPRALDREQRGLLAATLHGDAEGGGAGVHVLLACATASEPAHFCDELAAVLKKARWTVTRERIAPASPDTGVTAPRLQRIDVARDADDATQTAADALADGLESAGIVVEGPADAAPDAQQPSLRVTVH
jgi:hypothetical protein